MQQSFPPSPRGEEANIDSGNTKLEMKLTSAHGTTKLFMPK